MLERLKQFYQLSQYLGISYRQEGDQEIFRCCTIQRTKDSLEIENTVTYLGWEKLSAVKDKLVPVSLHIDSRQVLFKEYTGQIVDDESIKNIFPSYDADRFFKQELQGKDRSWYAFVRKDYVANLIQRFLQEGFIIISVSIGPFILDHILAQLNSYENRYTLDKHFIEIDADKETWKHYSYSDTHTSTFAIKVGDQPIKQEYVMAYAAAFSALMAKDLQDYSLAEPTVKDAFVTAIEKKKFKTNLLIFIGVFFFLLMVNALLFNMYYTENESLGNRVSTQQSTVKDLGKIEQEIKTNEELITQIGWNGGVSKAFLLDKIGASMRNFSSINLTQIQINPQQKVSGTKTVQYPQVLLIKGTCLSLNILNEWIRGLKDYKWIEKVNIEEYGSKQVGETSEAFTLKIEYNDQVEGN